ncbi:hypothetical protein SAMN05444395_104128 [Flavobacterium fryxellicola]|uniref:Outer membrane protein beta-barrel domain-containing protein n=1 Tax=Flavobacterium fryxellicola TaxID=249352 RepID=A0A167WCJ2_9FLAO|nr:DUF6048 family protein [Flavobacterium fryxellicola]OAB27231.1 hypothetical protein FBFR_11880 [Flavobacterium fryxellicola]SHN67469.1 hypothetical protein SAMN05444395_104128 [Flavobacterium fryxellicola]
MKHTLRSFFSFFLFLCFTWVQAQETTPKGESVKQTTVVKRVAVTPKTDQKIPDAPLPLVAIDPTLKKSDSIPLKTDRYGLRVGVDLYKVTRGLYDRNYKGIEFVGDYRLTKKYFLAAELGNENKTTDDDRVNFTTKGSYLKVGFDYNAYENWLDMENIISIGMRYGFSTFNQQLNSYRIYNANPYFAETPIIPSGKKFDGLSASWLEVVAGIKAKVFDNVFVGFSLRLNRLVTNKEPDNFSNLYIPGFNRTYDGSFGVGFNYTVTYFVPIYKKKVKPIAVPKQNDKK